MSMFVQKMKEDVLNITHNFVNHLEVRKRNKSAVHDELHLDYMECELASSRLILYASNWLNHLANENITADKRAFYIDSLSVKECCGVLESSPLYQKYKVFADIVSVIKRLQRVSHPREGNLAGKLNFSLSG